MPLNSVGCAARSEFVCCELRPFPRSLPPNPAGRSAHWALQRLRRGRDWGCVDDLVAGLADNEGLAPFPGHEGRPRGLAWFWCSELGEFGDLVDSHRGALPAQLAPARAEPVGSVPYVVWAPEPGRDRR